MYPVKLSQRSEVDMHKLGETDALVTDIFGSSSIRRGFKPMTYMQIMGGTFHSPETLTLTTSSHQGLVGYLGFIRCNFISCSHLCSEPLCSPHAACRMLLAWGHIYSKTKPWKFVQICYLCEPKRKNVHTYWTFADLVSFFSPILGNFALQKEECSHLLNFCRSSFILWPYSR